MEQARCGGPALTFAPTWGATFANVKAKGPPPNIGFQWSFRVWHSPPELAAGAGRMPNPLHWCLSPRLHTRYELSFSSPAARKFRRKSMAAKTKFKGSFTALVTPFKNGSLDEAAFRSLVNWQISEGTHGDRKSTRLNSSHVEISYAVFCLKKKKKKKQKKKYKIEETINNHK